MPGGIAKLLVHVSRFRKKRLALLGQVRARSCQLTMRSMTHSMTRFFSLLLEILCPGVTPRMPLVSQDDQEIHVSTPENLSKEFATDAGRKMSFQHHSNHESSRSVDLEMFK